MGSGEGFIEKSLHTEVCTMCVHVP